MNPSSTTASASPLSSAHRSADNYSVEVLLNLALVVGGYTLATALHLSGPIAIAVAERPRPSPGCLTVWTITWRNSSRNRLSPLLP